MKTNDIEIVVLAAGLGTRMKSSRIKILHAAAGRPVIDHVLDLAAGLSTAPPILVVGHQRDAVEEQTGDRARFALQTEQLGTGHAVQQTAELLRVSHARDVLILSGDVPLTRAETLRNLIRVHREQGNAATLLCMRLDDPGSYGRIVRDGEGQVVRIVEAKDASDEEREIREVNGGIYLFDRLELLEGLTCLSSDNAQGEFYLTDLIEILHTKGCGVGAVVVDDPMETAGVNSRAELAMVEKELSRRHLENLMASGVTFRNPEATLVDTTVEIGSDTVVYPFVTLEGSTRIGSSCVIQPGVHLKNTTVGDGVTVRTGTVAEESTIADGATVGPYAHLRPGTILGEGVKVGNFVETKKAVFGRGSKASHLSYIGDAEVGADVNIGAGTITCNYDGVSKHKTVLEDGVFIGSDSQLVAPVTVGRGAYVGAGSTITRDVPPDALALSRSPQRVIAGWAAKKREERKK